MPDLSAYRLVRTVACGARRRLSRPARRDVQPYVVERQRARDVLQHRVEVLLVEVLRQQLEMRAEAYGPEELPRLAWLLDALGEPAAHVRKPGGPKAKLRVAGRREVPGAR